MAYGDHVELIETRGEIESLGASSAIDDGSVEESRPRPIRRRSTKSRSLSPTRSRRPSTSSAPNVSRSSSVLVGRKSTSVVATKFRSVKSKPSARPPLQPRLDSADLKHPQAQRVRLIEVDFESHSSRNEQSASEPSSVWNQIRPEGVHSCTSCEALYLQYCSVGGRIEGRCDPFSYSDIVRGKNDCVVFKWLHELLGSSIENVHDRHFSLSWAPEQAALESNTTDELDFAYHGFIGAYSAASK